MPGGVRCSTVFLPPITSVWPALWPPWKRTTAPMSCVSRSTILPLPSSPHCAPSTTTDCPISRLLLRLGEAAAAAFRTGPHAEQAGGRLAGEPPRPAFVHYPGFSARRPAAAAGTGLVARAGIPALGGAASAASSSPRPHPTAMDPRLRGDDDQEATPRPRYSAP